MITRRGFAIGALTAACLRAQSSDDERAIRDLVAAYVKARNQDSPDAVRRLFTPDADQLVSSGEWRRGVDAIVQGTAASSKNEKSRSITVESVRLLDPQVAVVDGRYQTTLLNGTVRDMWTTFIVKRGSEGWRIAAVRNMKPTR